MSIAWGEGALYVTRVAARVVPERVVAVTATEGGEVEICRAGDGRAEKGELLVRVNPDELAMEEAELELQIGRSKVEGESELLQLTRQKEEMEFISTLPGNKRVYVEKHMEAKVDARALALLEQKIALVHERMRLNEAKLRAAFALKEQMRTIRMPFDGRVQFHVSPLPGSMRTPVASGDPLVTLADDSKLFVAVPVADPTLTLMEAQRLVVRLDRGEGALLQAEWSHRRVEKSGRDEALVYYFRVPEWAQEKAWAMLGANVVAELCCRGESDWLYEEKALLAREAGEQAFETWEALVAALRPGYVIVFSGETHLALRPQREDSP